MPEATATVPKTNGVDQPRYPSGHPRAGQFISTKAPREVAPFLGVIDRRTSRAQSYHDSLQGYVSDRGGPEHLSHAEAALCAQAAGLEVLCREFVTDHLAGREVSVESWLGAVGHFRRVVTTLGLKRSQIDTTPHLHDYIRQQDAAP